MSQNDFAELLVDYMDDRGFDAPELAREMYRVSDYTVKPAPSTITRWVTGKTKSPKRDLVKICAKALSLDEGQTKALLAAAGHKPQAFDETAALGAYRRAVRERYGYIQIFGQPEPVPLKGVFTHLNILDRPSAWRRFDLEELKHLPPHELAERLKPATTERVKGLQMVTQPGNNRLFILGKPGAGKTTFLKYLALQTVQREIDKVPMFVSLKEWADSGLDLLPFIVRQFEICDFAGAKPHIERLLHEGKALVLFDGLDEIQREGQRRDRAISALREFSDRYRHSQLLITCRVAATEYTFERFKYVEVADFDEEQMHVFVGKWFGDGELSDGFWNEFTKKEHRGLRELGRTPLLLTLLCLAYQETLSFPQHRAELYEQALDALLRKWDVTRKIKRDVVYEKLTLRRKQQMLARLAAGTFESGDYFLHQAEWGKHIVTYLQNLPPADRDEEIDGEAVLKAIEAQHGILVQCARRVYTFAHLTFQEYYTARYVVDSVASGDAGAIPRLLAHAHEDRWREVILLAASMFSNADAFFSAFLEALDALVEGDEKLDLNFISF